MFLSTSLINCRIYFSGDDYVYSIEGIRIRSQVDPISTTPKPSLDHEKAGIFVFEGDFSLFTCDPC